MLPPVAFDEAAQETRARISNCVILSMRRIRGAFASKCASRNVHPTLKAPGTK